MHMHRQCKDQSEWCLQTEKLLSFTWLMVLRLHLSCTLHTNPVSVITLQFLAHAHGSTEILFLRGVCSQVNIHDIYIDHDLRLCFELLLWNIDV